MAITLPDLRRLPAPVLQRLAEHPEPAPAGQWRGLDVRQRGRVMEARTVKRVELRTTDDGSPILEGYASVFDWPYEVAGGPPWGWVETIASGAFTKTLLERDPVVLLFDHEGMPYASTKARTLKLEQDSVGLRVETPDGLDTSAPRVADLVSAMTRGDVDEMSFAFRVIRQEWNEDYTERTIREVQLFDVSVVTYPANPATVAQIRDGGSDNGPDTTDRSDINDADDTSTDPTGDDGENRGMSLAFARALLDTI